MIPYSNLFGNFGKNLVDNLCGKINVEKDDLLIEKLEEFISKGDDVNKHTHLIPMLHWAYLNGFKRFARYLLEQGAEVNSKDWIGFSVLDYISKRCEYEVKLGVNIAVAIDIIKDLLPHLSDIHVGVNIFLKDLKFNRRFSINSRQEIKSFVQINIEIPRTAFALEIALC